MEATASDDQISKFSLRSGDVIFTKDSESADDIAKAAYVPNDLPGVVCGYHLSIIRTGIALSGKYIKRYFDSYPAKAYFEVHANGLTRVGLGQQAVNTLPVPLPPLPEQIQIARFLDYETARIDALIAEQQRLIELLKEKRQAVISHAVTQGLDPTAPMKDSGVEWLGKIPKHWEVGRISQFYQEEVEKGIIELPVLQVSIHHGVSDKELTEEESDRKINRIEDREKYKRVRPGDLVYNMMRAWQGGFGAVVVDGLVSPAYVVARPRQHNITLYIEKLLRTPNAMEEMRRYSYGITDFRLRLYWDQFKNIKIPIPPRGEIDRILGKVKKVQSEVDCLVIEAEKLTSILQERRSALISAAVTGKIDVRDWEPPRNSDGFSEPISSEVA